MKCSICKRNNCTASFHSIEEQEQHEELFGEYEFRIEELKEEIERLRSENELFWDIMTHDQRLEIERKLEVE